MFQSKSNLAQHKSRQTTRDNVSIVRKPCVLSIVMLVLLRGCTNGTYTQSDTCNTKTYDTRRLKAAFLWSGGGGCDFAIQRFCDYFRFCVFVEHLRKFDR